MPKLQPGLSLWALNNYLEEDGGVFKDVSLTERLNLTTCIDTIIEKWGTCDLIISDPRIVVRRTQLFFLKNYDNFEKMAEALLADYNPIENYDRYEDTSENRDINKSGGNQSTASGEGSSSSGGTNTVGGYNTEHQISAMNSNDYQKRNKDITSARTDTYSNESTSSDSSSTSGSFDESTDDDFERTSHIHGNIGVTTSQQMIQSEIELRKFNIYDYIADLYASEFLYRIW